MNNWRWNSNGTSKERSDVIWGHHGSLCQCNGLETEKKQMKQHWRGESPPDDKDVSRKTRHRWVSTSATSHPARIHPEPQEEQQSKRMMYWATPEVLLTMGHDLSTPCHAHLCYFRRWFWWPQQDCKLHFKSMLGHRVKVVQIRLYTMVYTEQI